MLLNGRLVLVGLLIIIAAVGIVMWIEPLGQRLAWLIAACAVLSIVILNMRTVRLPGRKESDDIRALGEARRRELVRGTSLYLREMRYRYSIRIDPSETTDHKSFVAEVNRVRLGFVPVIITDNTNDRQGFGYVAFVYDGDRWRGPGLPCPSDQPEAVRHAARCVSPLATEEETRC